MKKSIILMSVAVLVLGASESRAELVGTWPCGDKCTATLDDEGNFLITGSGEMTDYEVVRASNGAPVITTAPWADYLTQITNLEINGVSSIGKSAFYNNKYSINNVSVKIDDSVEEIHSGAFHKIGMKDLEMSDSVKSIDAYAFTENKLTQITLPETLTYLADSALGRSESNDLTIICKGSNCSKLENLLKNYTYSVSVLVPNDLSGAMVPADDTNCESTNYYWSGSSCNNKKNGIICDKNFKRIEDWCNRVRWTPAEVAKVLRDDNTNVVTITFRL